MRGVQMNKHKIHSNQDHPEKGQSLVEFSVILVIVLLLLSGVFDLGRALYVYMSLRDAAQEGALYGSVNPNDTSGIRSRASNSSNSLQSFSYISGANITTDISVTGSACVGNAITVKVSYTNFPITMPFLGTILGRQYVGISASVTDTILSPACT